MNEHTLIIDDDPSFNAILVRTLERRGHLACGALDTVSAMGSWSFTSVAAAASSPSDGAAVTEN